MLKIELEAYIVSNDQLAADEEPEQADKEDENQKIRMKQIYKMVWKSILN